MQSRTFCTVLVTLLEGPMVFLWLLFSHDQKLSPWILLLAIGELAETTSIGIQLKGLMARPEPGDRDGIKRQQLKLARAFLLAIPFEMATWAVWLYAANEFNQWIAFPVLLVLMHLKHQWENAAVCDTPYTKDLFAPVGAIASAAEAVGAAGCLALLKADQPVLAAAALALGFLVEHALLIDALIKETERRDVGVPLPRRPPMPLRLRLLLFFGTRFRPVWRAIDHTGPLRRLLNKAAINGLVKQVPPRPNPWSTMAPYTSWASLTDRTYSGRHLPPTLADPAAYPPLEKVADLFQRASEAEPCPKSTLLFPSFAQWFVDGFLRTQRDDGLVRKRDTTRNESTHDVDLAQLYGLDDKMLAPLRTFKRGLLRSQQIDGEEYPPHLARNGVIKPEFRDLMSPFQFARSTREQKDQMFAMGTDTRNLGFVAFNVLFLREHNRIAKVLACEHPGWDDRRLFATARMVLTVILMKIVVQEYINHITSVWFKLRVPRGAMQRETWQRPNWMAIEFDLLYRWHSLIPNQLVLDGRRLGIEQSLAATEVLTSMGLGAFMTAASAQRAARIGLFNTHPFLVRMAEQPTLEQGRTARLRSYNDYREMSRLPRLHHFGEFSTRPVVRDRLRALYDTVDDVEFYVGLFAEEGGPNDVLPPLMAAMVAFDAFSQLLTNPLLHPRLFGPQTFSRTGMKIIEETNTIKDLVCRNTGASRADFISLTREDYTGP